MLVEFVITAAIFLLIFEIDFRASGDLDCLLLTAQLKRRELPIQNPIWYRRPGGWAPPIPQPVPFPPDPPPAPRAEAPGFKAAPPIRPDIPGRPTAAPQPQIF